MPEFPQGSRLDLPDALPGDVELLAHLFQRPGPAIVNAETESQHPLLSGGQRG